MNIAIELDLVDIFLIPALDQVKYCIKSEISIVDIFSILTQDIFGTRVGKKIFL